ncbi:MAG: DUF1641 domain-containing protein [Halodesulfurarchaeum sp.]
MSPDASGPTGEEDLDAVLAEMAEHREAVEDLLDVVDTFDENGALDLLAAVGTRNAAGTEQLYEAFAEDPANLRAVQNLSLLAAGLSRVDPDVLAATMGGDAVDADEFAEPPELGLVGILQQLRDPEVRRGLGVVFLLLKQLGARSTSPAADGGGE